MDLISQLEKDRKRREELLKMRKSTNSNLAEVSNTDLEPDLMSQS